jgi:hypothetical protein
MKLTILGSGTCIPHKKRGSENFTDFKIASAKVPHMESSLAYKIELKGKSLVYSGETDYS